MPDDAPLDWTAEADEEDDTYLTANLFPRTTGLPMTVRVSERGGARHDPRVKVSTVHGDRPIRRDEQAIVAVRPQPRILHGDLSRRDLEAVGRWVVMNSDVILDYWTGDADTSDLVARLKRLPD